MTTFGFRQPQKIGRTRRCDHAEDVEGGRIRRAHFAETVHGLRTNDQIERIRKLRIEQIIDGSRNGPAMMCHPISGCPRDRYARASVARIAYRDAYLA